MRAKMFWLISVLWLLLVANASAFYDPGVQRWLNRDPIAEEGGINLHEFAFSAPIDVFDPFGLVEGSKKNVEKRKRIDEIARGYDGSRDWRFDVKKDNFPKGSNKCNKFVYDVTKEARAEALVTVKDKKGDVSRPPLAAEYADKNTKIPNWRPLKAGEKPEPGDIAAYKLLGGGTRYSGHTGIITSDGKGGTSNISAHADMVSPDPNQFSDPDTCYRRYTGD